MKMIYKVILITMTLFYMSCKKSYLELTPQQAVSDTKALQNLEDLNSTITGIYDEISLSPYYGRYMLTIPDVMADDIKQNSQANRIRDYAEHTIARSDADANNLWTGMYRAINSANNIINSDIKVISAVQAEKDHIIGEAYALRGLIYFDLVRLYGQHYSYTADAGHMGVPLILDYDPARKPKRNTVKEVYAQVINDMTKAIAMMKSTSKSKNSNTLSSTSVKALLARVYLNKEDWANAETMATAVIGGGYSLLSNANYLNLWTTDNSTESIFEISMTDSDNRGNNSIAGLYLKEIYGDYLPSKDVVSLYNVADVRLKALKTDPLLAGPYAPYRVNKYPDVKGYDNIKVIRLAEIYLIRAEARANLGTNNTGAQQDLNMVRLRALSTAAPVTDIGQELKDKIMLERRLELCFEGQRLWDLMRTKKDIVRIQCTAVKCLIPYGDKTNVLPIPQVETDTNPNMTQNPGY